MKEYEMTGHRTFAKDDDGVRTLLANFTATISEEIRYVDNQNVETFLTLSGIMPGLTTEEGLKPDPILLPQITIPASDFPQMSWVMKHWGVRCVISPGSSSKEDLRTAIQLYSQPRQTTIYRHIGWEMINNKLHYLHAGGGITAKGHSTTHRVELPSELQRYNLNPVKSITPKDAILATLGLRFISKPEIAWPLLAATFAPILGPVDFGIHVTGRTGTFKSEVASLFQSHYGAELDARHLPASWSSTPNALEALAYFAANAVLVIDDFVPSGSSWQVRNYHTAADKIVRAQGNQAGRARLTDTSHLQQTMYPRGIVLSTGEDTPDGHSVRARLLILDLSPGDVETTNLTKAQHNRRFYAQTTFHYIQHVAANPINVTPEVELLRERYIQYGHSRTPTMLARLVTTIEHFLAFATSLKAISKEQQHSLMAEATKAILTAGAKQTYFLESADPTDLFMAALRHVLSAGLAHLRTVNGGIPLSAPILGWTEENNHGEIKTYRSHGPTIGWIDWDTDDLWIDATLGYNTIRKTAGNELAVTKQTLFKRMKDAGLLTRVDDLRQRNTIRITAEGHGRQVLALPLAQALDQQEKPNREPGED